MSHCWRANPNERPHFSEIEEIIGYHLETSISSYYLDLNIPYTKLNDEKVRASLKDSFGLKKLLDSKEKLSLKKTRSLTTEPGIFQKIGTPFSSLKKDPGLSKARHVR